MAIRMNTVKLLCMHITHTIMIVYNVLSNGDLYGGREEPPVATLENLQWEYEICCGNTKMLLLQRCEIHCRNTNSTAEMQNSEAALLQCKQFCCSHAKVFTVSFHNYT